MKIWSILKKLTLGLTLSYCLEMSAIPNVIENLNFLPSQSPGVGRSQLAGISNTGDVAIAPSAGALASVQNQVFNHIGYNHMSSEQKTIGIIGGASWESTVIYYKLINESVRERLGNLNSAKILLHSVNYEPIVKLEQEGRWDEIDLQLGSAAKNLQDAGADFLILCCNTLHKVTPAIEATIEIPFLHIADAAGSILSDSKIQKIGLLGTQFTMEDGFYSSRLENKFGLEVITPTLSDRKLIDHIIYQELCQGKISPRSKEELIRIIQLLQNEGAQAVLLGCTELGMLITSKDAEIPVYDTTLLHAEEAVNMSFKPKKIEQAKIIKENEIQNIAIQYAERIWDKKDLTGIEKLLHENVIIHSVLGEYHGPESMKKIVQAWLIGFPDLTVNNTSVISDKDLVVVHWEAQGTHSGEFKGIQPTGNLVSYPGVTIYRINQNKIVEYWAYVDMQNLLKQIK